jgi:hypothetical protein
MTRRPHLLHHADLAEISHHAGISSGFGAAAWRFRSNLTASFDDNRKHLAVSRSRGITTSCRNDPDPGFNRSKSPRSGTRGRRAAQQPETTTMQCKLGEVKNPVWPGRTFFTTSVGGGMLPAAVYMPPNHNASANRLNVLLFLHGYYVGSTEALTNSDNCRLCEQVIASGKDIILIAPWLGYKNAPDKEHGVLQTERLTEAKYGERFLKAILDALPEPSTATLVASAAIGGADAISGAGPMVKIPPPPQLEIKNLVVACHSAGGVAMRNVVQTLGAFEGKLRECVGLDCLYNDGDAKFWHTRAQVAGASPSFFFYGPSTIRESIKLYLMAQGRADASGNRREPPGRPLDNLVVRPGHISSYMSGGVTTNVSGYIDKVADDLIARAKPTAAPPSRTSAAKDGEFVKQAAENFKAGYIFPFNEGDARGGIHYFIARAFLLERLRSVSLP